MRHLFFVALLLAIAGCSGCSSDPVRPGKTEGPPPAPTTRIDGTWDNLPRRPHVEVIIDKTGVWQASVWNPPVMEGEGNPYLTCKDTLLSLGPTMVFSGQGAADTTAHLLGFWENADYPPMPMYGYFEATYHHTFLSKHGRNVGPLIEGKFILSVGGACQSATESHFWLSASP